MDIRRFLETRVERHLDKPFLFFEDEVYSYQAFDRRINKFANALLELGIRKGDRVCLYLPNIPDFLFSWFALSKIGAVMVPLNVAFKNEEAGYIINHCEAAGVIIDADHQKMAGAFRADCRRLKWVLGTGSNILEKGVIPFSDILADMGEELKGFDIKNHDIAQIAYTSGTTGFPKGAIHTHENFTLTGEAFTICAALKPHDRLMIVMPLFHANAQFYSTMGALAAEAAVVLVRNFSAGNFWNQAVKYQVTEFNFVGAIGRILSNRPPDEFRPEHRIRTAYGALVNADVYEIFTRRFGIKNVIDGYGLTEVPRVCQNPIGGTIKMNSIGLPAKHPDPKQPFSQIKIVGEDGREAGPGAIGEITVKSPVMMKGYHKDAQATQQAFKDGWFYTGDMGYRDEDGYIFFVDRKKDIIRKKGENLSPAELEAAINTHPKVSESAVIAVPSEVGEDEILACIVPALNARLNAEEIIDWCKPRLAGFKLPRYVKFMQSLPKTATARIAKYRLKENPAIVETAVDMKKYLKKELNKVS